MNRCAHFVRRQNLVSKFIRAEFVQKYFISNVSSKMVYSEVSRNEKYYFRRTAILAGVAPNAYDFKLIQNFLI